MILIFTENLPKKILDFLFVLKIHHFFLNVKFKALLCRLTDTVIGKMPEDDALVA
jgi:hypothetical protein